MRYYLVHTLYDTDPDLGDIPILDRVDWGGSWLILAHGDVAIARTGATPQLAEGLEGHCRGLGSDEERAAAVPAYVFFALADLDPESRLADDPHVAAARIRHAAVLRDADADADDHARLRVERAEAAYSVTLLAVALRETLAGRPLT